MGIRKLNYGLIFLPMLAFGVFGVALFAHAAITITAPVAGTSWQAGTTHTISWTGGGPWVTRIYLNNPTAAVSVIITNISNTGSYSWAIPAGIAPATNYLIYVETAPCNGCAATDWVYGPQFTITAASSNASFISQTPPPLAMTAGQTANVSVTMQNTGTTVWTAAGNYRLGSQNPQDNANWGTNRVNLGAGDSIASGQQKTFNFTVTAPGTPGTYNFQWRMVQEGIAWFGSLSTNVVVTVTAVPILPTVTTNAASGVTSSSAALNGSANPNGSAATGWFRYSAINPGSCNDTFGTRLPASGGTALGSGSAAVAYSNSAGGLASGTTYYYCAIASTAGGTAFGSVVSFSTPLPAAPAVSLTASPTTVVTGYPSTLTWTSSGADSCSASANPANGNWTGSKVLNGSQSSGILTQTATFTITCTNIGGSTSSSATVTVMQPPNVSGYAWAGSGASDGTNSNPALGWIHISGTATDGSPYGILVAADGTMSGYAWANPNDSASGSNHIGWIDFAPVGPYPASSFVLGQAVRLDTGAGTVRGWARVCSVFASGCSGALRSSSDLGGWDGWIGFGSGGSYGSGVTVSGCAWSGYAWGGGTNIGWIHFANSAVPYAVTGSGVACVGGTIAVNATLNGAPWPSSGTASVNYSLSGASAYFGTLVPQTITGEPTGSYTIAYGSGGPAGATFASVSPSATQTLSLGGTVTFTMNFTTAPPPPVAVVMSVAPQNACKIVNVSWGSSSGATGYNAQRCTDSGCALALPIPVCSVLSPAVSCVDTTAPGGVSLWYRVNAYNGFGTSAWSYSASSVTNNAPDVSFSYSPSTNIVVNQLVRFAGQLLGGSAVTSQSWTFAGGNPASSSNASPGSRFAAAGSHVVTYTANNASGSCTVSQSVSVAQNTFGDWCELPPDALPGTLCP